LVAKPRKKKAPAKKRPAPDVSSFGSWKVGQTAFFRPKLYGYKIWTQGKIWDFTVHGDGTATAYLTPCGPGWGPITAAGSTWCIKVEDLHKKEVKAPHPKAKKTELYTTRRKKRRKKKK